MPIQHEVQPGDCIASIAYTNGLFWKTVWEHADNAELKKRRGSPFHLLPGDIVVVPDKRESEVTKPNEATHKFRLKGVPAVMIVTVLREKTAEEEEGESSEAEPSEDPESASLEEAETALPEEEPAGDVEYQLRVGTRVVKGRTDDEGRVKVLIMPDDREGVLIVEPGTPNERAIGLTLGGLDPIDTPSGIAQRLNNLGFGPVEHGTDVPPGAIADAITAFQKMHGLEATGRADQATLEKLHGVHGS